MDEKPEDAASGLADDARKIAGALVFIKARTNELAERTQEFGSHDKACAAVKLAAAAIPLTESLPGKIEELTTERDALASKDQGWTIAVKNLLKEQEAAASQLAARESEVGGLWKALVIAERHLSLMNEQGNVTLGCGQAAELCRAALAALSHPAPVVAEGCEPSDEAVAATLSKAGTRASIWSSEEFHRDVARKGLRAAYAIDLAPRVASARADAFSKAAELLQERISTGCNPRLLVGVFRALAKEPAPDDAREKEATERDEVTDHEAFGAMIHRGKQEARGNGDNDPDY